MDAVTTYKLFAANSDKALERITSSPQVAREVAYYEENIGKIKNSEDFIADSRLLNFALKAFGLEEMSYAKAFMKKLIDGDRTDDKALVNQLTDPKYKEFADAFDFPTFKSATTSFDRASKDVVAGFLQANLEQEAGTQNTGARLAIYFQRKAEEVENPYSIIADRALFRVVQTAFSLPQQLAATDVDKQADIIREKLDVDDLKDPEFVQKLTDRFLNLWDTQNGPNVAVPPLVGFAGTTSLSLDLISSIQTFRR